MLYIANLRRFLTGFVLAAAVAALIRVEYLMLDDSLDGLRTDNNINYLVRSSEFLLLASGIALLLFAYAKKRKEQPVGSSSWSNWPFVLTFFGLLNVALGLDFIASPVNGMGDDVFIWTYGWTAVAAVILIATSGFKRKQSA